MMGTFPLARLMRMEVAPLSSLFAALGNLMSAPFAVQTLLACLSLLHLAAAYFFAPTWLHVPDGEPPPA